MSTIKTNAILDASGGNTTTINGTTPTAYNTMGKNLIINGAMQIAQRGTSASITTAQTYKTVDRFRSTGGFSGYTNTESIDTSVVPEGFTHSYKWANTASAGTVSSGAYNVIEHKVEGYNISHLDWGKSTAKTVTLSFWVRSGVTGTYGLGIVNGSSNVYMTTYTINSADTWEKKTITILGPTIGTWNTTNGTAFTIRWDMGVGTTYTTATTEDWSVSGNIWGYTGGVKFVETNNVDFYITGVQLEVGSVATEFERRPFGYELGLCQRYFTKSDNYDTVPGTGSREELAIYAGLIANAHTQGNVNFPVEMRAQPTLVFYHPSSGASNQIGYYGDAGTVYYVNISRKNTKGITEVIATTSVSECARFHFTASAEL